MLHKRLAAAQNSLLARSSRHPPFCASGGTEILHIDFIFRLKCDAEVWREYARNQTFPESFHNKDSGP